MRKPAKKIITVFGEEETKKQAIKTFSEQAKKVFAPRDLVMDNLKESLHHKLEGELTAPLVVTSHHVRAFFSKLQLGIRSVQEYVGKTLNTREEVINYFLKNIGEKAYGTDWLLKQAIEFYNHEKEGIFLITDLAQSEVKKLKKALGSNLLVVYAGESTTEKADYSIRPQQTTAAMRRMTKQYIEKVTNPRKEGISNERSQQSQS